jgi:hypothetical protein
MKNGLPADEQVVVLKHHAVARSQTGRKPEMIDWKQFQDKNC